MNMKNQAHPKDGISLKNHLSPIRGKKIRKPTICIVYVHTHIHTPYKIFQKNILKTSGKSDGSTDKGI